MPTIKRYISNDGVEHDDVPAMRAHEIVNDVQLALSSTLDEFKHWLAGGLGSAEKRDALLRTAVRVGRARPEGAKRPRASKATMVAEPATNAASEAGNGPSVDASGDASTAVEQVNQAA